jgi:hypothetical protein
MYHVIDCVMQYLLSNPCYVHGCRRPRGGGEKSGKRRGAGPDSVTLTVMLPDPVTVTLTDADAAQLVQDTLVSLAFPNVMHCLCPTTSDQLLPLFPQDSVHWDHVWQAIPQPATGPGRVFKAPGWAKELGSGHGAFLLMSNEALYEWVRRARRLMCQASNG